MTTTSPSLDKINRAFNFEVTKLPLYGPERLETGYYGLFRDDTGAFVGSGSISKKYQEHTTDDVLALCEAVDTAFDGTANVDCYFEDGHYVTIEPNKDMRRSIFGTSDNIFPRFMVRGGYGRSGGSFYCSVGMYRDLCYNMQMLRSVKSTFISIPHFSGLRSKMDELIHTVGSLKEGWENLFATFERMEQNQVDLASFLDSIYGRPTPEQLALVAAGEKVRAVTSHENRTRAIVTRIIKERNQTGRNNGMLGTDGLVTGWEAFNAVQGYIQHKGDDRKSTFQNILAANRGAGRKTIETAMELALAS